MIIKLDDYKDTDSYMKNKAVEIMFRCPEATADKIIKYQKEYLVESKSEAVLRLINYAFYKRQMEDTAEQPPSNCKGCAKCLTNTQKTK